MSKTKKTPIEKLSDYMESPEGIAQMDEYVRKMEKEDIQFERDYKRFCRLVNTNGLDVMIDKMTKHYGSDKYINREHKLGYEPRDPLNGHLLQYFEEFGKPTDEENWGDFTAVEYTLNSWIVGLAIGQGSFIYINEIKNK